MIEDFSFIETEPLPLSIFSIIWSQDSTLFFKTMYYYLQIPFTIFSRLFIQLTISQLFNCLSWLNWCYKWKISLLRDAGGPAQSLFMLELRDKLGAKYNRINLENVRILKYSLLQQQFSIYSLYYPLWNTSMDHYDLFMPSQNHHLTRMLSSMNSYPWMVLQYFLVICSFSQL